MGAGCSSSKGECTSGPAIEVQWRRFHNIPHLPEWEGPKCDSVGFFQHYGECWNDSLQMILLFTDGLKELTQPLLYNTEITQDWVDAHIDEKSRGTRLSQYIYYYLRAMQRRFKRHYATETAMRRLAKPSCDASAEEMRKAKLGIELFYRRTGINAIQSAIYGSFRPNANTTTVTKYMNKKNIPTHGRSKVEVDKLLEQLLKVLGIETNVVTDVQEPQESSVFKEFMSPTPFPANLRAVRVNSGEHATEFYICGGKHYFYDDNLGVIPFRWDRFFKASSYDGIEEFILAKPQGATTVSRFKTVEIPATKSRAKTKKAQESNNAFLAKVAAAAAAAAEEKRVAEAAKRRKQDLELATLFVAVSGEFRLAYADLKEGDFFFAYYPFIKIKNRMEEVRFYTLSPTTGEPRFYRPDEVKHNDATGFIAAASGTTFAPIYVNSDVEITNTNYNLQSSEIRASQRRGLRNSTEMNEFRKLQAFEKTFKPNNYLTRKNNQNKNKA